MAILNMFSGGAGVRIPLESPTNIALDVHTGEVRLSWTDPVDKVATPGGELVSKWSYTLIVRKVGSYPTSPLDGVQVFKSTTRDAYKNAYYSDLGLTNGTQYYYALYAYTTLGVYSEPLLGTATPVSGLLTYYGSSITPFSKARAHYGAAVAGNQYAVFLGGTETKLPNVYSTGVGDSLANVDAYSTSLSRISVDDIPTGVIRKFGTSFRNYAVFGGGALGGRTDIHAYNASLTRSSPEKLTDGGSYGNWDWCSPGANSNYVLFAGGDNAYDSRAQDHVAGYDSSFTKLSSVTELGFRSYAMGSVTRGENIIFVGGVFDAGDHATNYMHIYDSSLTYTQKYDMLNPKRGFVGVALAGDHIVVGGGSTYETFTSRQYASDVVEAFDTSFTRTMLSSLSQEKNIVYATSLGKYAIFGGGLIGTKGPAGTDLGSVTVDAYDSSLTKTIAHDISTMRYYIQAVTLGQYAIFGSGWDDDVAEWSGGTGQAGTSIDAFTLE